MKELKGEFKVAINYEEWTIAFEANKDCKVQLDEGQVLFVSYECFHDDRSGGGSERELFLRGYVKWDGCSNWTFDEHCMLHACTMRGLELFSKLPLICAEHALEYFELEVHHG